MKTFDDIQPAIFQFLWTNKTTVDKLDWFVINRDLTGRVRFIAPDSAKGLGLEDLYKELGSGSHTYKNDSGVLYESALEPILRDAVSLCLVPGKVWFVDRTASASVWSKVSEVSQNNRVVFYSTTSTQDAAAALLSEVKEGDMVIDLDLEGAGLRSGALPIGGSYGVVDWLIEDLVNNGDAVIDEMENSFHMRRFHMVSAVGNADTGTYLLKLAKVMTYSMAERLNRLIATLEERHKPTRTLILAPAGLGEIASNCVTELGAAKVHLFGHPNENGMLFNFWKRQGIFGEMQIRLF